MSNQINTTPLTQFAQILRAAELSQSKEVKMPIQQARLLNLALTEIQDKLLQDYTALFLELKSSSETEVIQVSMDGGGFKNK
jgi:TorA maturation chaperone TorD